MSATPIRSNKAIESEQSEVHVQEKTSIILEDQYAENPEELNTELKEEVVHDEGAIDSSTMDAEEKSTSFDPSLNEVTGSDDEKLSVTAAASPRNQNYRMKHIKLRQKYISATKKVTEEMNELSSLHQTHSNLTSASQVTTVHRNTAITSVNSNISEHSEVSSFGKYDTISSLSNDNYLKEWERQRNGHIVLGPTAGSNPVTGSKGMTETIKEENHVDTRIQSDFDPYAVNEPSVSNATEMEIEMKDVIDKSPSKGENIHISEYGLF